MVFGLATCKEEAGSGQCQAGDYVASAYPDRPKGVHGQRIVVSSILASHFKHGTDPRHRQALTSCAGSRRSINISSKYAREGPCQCWLGLLLESGIDIEGSLDRFEYDDFHDNGLDIRWKVN